jgi:hypothetical protein
MFRLADLPRHAPGADQVLRSGSIRCAGATFWRSWPHARAGIDLDRSTLADRVGQMARLMRPLIEAVGTHVMSAERVHADDTPVPVLNPGRGKTTIGRLWCYVRDDRPFAGTAATRVPNHTHTVTRPSEHDHASVRIPTNMHRLWVL